MDKLQLTLKTVLATYQSLLPDWVLSCAIFGGGLAVALIAHLLVYFILGRVADDESLLQRSLVSRTRRAGRWLFVLVGVWLAAAAAPSVNDHQLTVVRQAVAVGVILLLGYITLAVLHSWVIVHLRRFKLDSADNLLARKHVTQSRILERVAETLIVIVTLSAALMTFDDVRQYGISLLASAGAVGLIAGLALQPMLKNMVAGIQLAVTQPIRIEDALLVEGEWGHVEEITSSYVVVRLWDWRRLIVPLSYFIEKPFQNWTREGAALIGSVFLYTDFTVPVGELRSELEKIVRQTPLWDGQVVGLQVTDFKQSTMEIRVLVSASDSAKVFDLRCEVREKLIGFIQDRYPQSLPRLRTDIVPDEVAQRPDWAYANVNGQNGSGKRGAGG